MTGQFKGVATRFKNKYPRLKTFHCMAHRLELAVKNAVDDVNPVSHFRTFIDCIYKHYSMSPKNQHGLQIIASDLGAQLLKVRKIFDVRWVFSSFQAMKAVWRGFPALYGHIQQCSTDRDRSRSEKAKCKGIISRMSSWLFVAEVAMLKDALRLLTQLSHFCQNKKANIMEAQSRVGNVIDSLSCLKETEGKSVKAFMDSFATTEAFKGVKLLRNDGDEVKFIRLRSQFYQALCDKMRQRFVCTDLLSNLKALDEANWPNDPIERTLYGDKQVSSLSKDLGFETDDIVDILFEYAEFKKTRIAKSKLALLQRLVNIYPVSSTDFERGFSVMNLQHTEFRNSLATETVSSLLMISINGPALEFWQPRPYVVTWLQKRHHGALDKPTGIPKKKT